jgi:hypothetical protein
MFHFTSIIYTAARDTSSSKNVHQVIPLVNAFANNCNPSALFVAVDMFGDWRAARTQKGGVGPPGPGGPKNGPQQSWSRQQQQSR